MSPPKIICFLLEGLNALATTYHFFYLYFFAEARFGFDQGQNLLLATALGLAYAGASIVGGQIAQRWGYLKTLGLGCAIMGCGQLVASGADGLVVHGIVALGAVMAMGMTWPALEALAADGATGRRLQNLLGVYNLVWSLGGAFAYLTGGAMIESWGLNSIFLVPAALNVVQVSVIVVLARKLSGLGPAGRAEDPYPDTDGLDSGLRRDEGAGSDRGPSVPRAVAQRFLRMAWYANPLAYLTINTVVALGPALAKTLSLSPRYAGYYCSIWMFMRSGAFLLLWLWPGWHYRFRWLLAAYLGMITTFIWILLSPNVTSLVAAQLGFGLCVGLIYYSSLYYSMDAGEAKGEHGGIHEAAIGLGCAAGPAIGAAALYLAPQMQNGTAKAVGILLLLGVGGLLHLWRGSESPD